MSDYPKRLIEVDLPIKKISAHARREKSIRHGHISTLHIGWAQRPLAACRAVICAAAGPDPADPLSQRPQRRTAQRLRHDYWLDVVCHCATPAPSLHIFPDSATLDWQPIGKVEHCRRRQDSVKHPVELKAEPPPYGGGR